MHSLKSAPRWSAIGMTNKQVCRPAPDVLVLAYKAEAKRDEADVYRAYCTSTPANQSAGKPPLKGVVNSPRQLEHSGTNWMCRPSRAVNELGAALLRCFAAFPLYASSIRDQSVPQTPRVPSG